MLPTLVATLLFISAQAPNDIVCPVLGDKVAVSGPSVEFGGAKYWFCCDECAPMFKEGPSKFVKANAEKGRTAGVFLFDPVSHERIEAKDAKGGETDYKGVRYLFISPENKAAFQKDPAKFATVPKQEALFCPVGKEAVASPSRASGYSDYKGVRYYMCCAGCEKTFSKTPESFAPQVKAHVKDLSVVATPVEAKSQDPAASGPMEVECTHCKKRMTIKDKADAETRCNVCGCGVAKKFCVKQGG